MFGACIFRDRFKSLIIPVGLLVGSSELVDYAFPLEMLMKLYYGIVSSRATITLMVIFALTVVFFVVSLYFFKRADLK